MIGPLVIRFPRPVSSKKNRRRPMKKGSRMTGASRASKQAESDEKTFRTLAILAAREKGWKMAEDDEIGIEVDYIVETDDLEVRVYNLGPRPKGKTGRTRDLHGMIETICDALQPAKKGCPGIYSDDRQVASVRMERIYLRSEEASP